MNRLYSILLVITPLVVRSQQAEHVRDSITSVVSELTDTTQKVTQRTDSTLAAQYKQLQTIGKKFTAYADSLRAAYDNQRQRIDLKQPLFSSVDSLQSDVSEKQQRIQDSLQSEVKALLQRFTRQLDSLKSSTKQKLDSLQLPPELRGQVDQYTSTFGAVNLDTKALPQLNVDGLNLTELPDLELLEGKLAIPGVDLPIDNLGNLSETVSGYSADAKAIMQGNFNEVQQLPKTIENTIVNQDELKGLTEQGKQLEKMTSLPTEEETKQQLTQQATEAAIDHFAGQQEVLSEAMQKMSKYKKKYPSISGLEDLTKRPPNPLKEKPFVERLIPGISFQYQRVSDIVKWDTYIYCGYQIIPRISAGAGWNQRIHYSRKAKTFMPGTTYGPRAYTDVRLYRGFIGHVEVESQYAALSKHHRGSVTEGESQWVWSVLTGLKTEYRITRWLRGTTLIQYNLFDRHHKAPYTERVNVRFGFEFILKKRKKQTD